MANASLIVAEARKWIGTPYQHQASCLHAGCDCLGLVRGVWRALIGDEPELAPPYTPNWAEDLQEETLLEAARRHLIEIPIGGAQIGDVLAFRMGLGAPVKHLAIVSKVSQGKATNIIHAYWGRSVVETHLGPWWSRRIAAAFQFPNF
ncbi:C40 family peptidase [Hirschia baltica]|uniref:Phage cell wall peptidase, NlpC/P60 family n=1 Tax=Hirschia baltica (strain ATCC 49814 / DSM 5838 / IFAM 1418) TaxID=582402 RepID=C6XID2_HIRBI|nr:peptidase [Hirschia baltica]ACT58958.1 phage cell wall peptidase, NlpC/P60 family [Hirschia baltica ATCC 49814]